MMSLAQNKKLSIVISICLLSAAQFAYGKTYRWIDENGEIYYSDKVPPEYAKYKRQTLSDSARVIAEKEAAKTKAQWEREKRLRALQQKQAQMIAKQKADDKVLLATFRSVYDMRTTLKAKLMATDALIKVSQGNKVRLQQQLEAQQQKAATYERNGKPIPKKLLNEIHSSKEQIKLTTLEINKFKAKKENIRKDFEADIKRFVYLTQSDTEDPTIVDQSTEQSVASQLGLFDCENSEQCTRAWKYAREYVKKYSTTPLDTDSKVLIMSAEPTLADDISLSVSRMAETGTKNRLKLFLDIRCRNSSLGKELCASKKVSEIRTSFYPYIQSALAAEQKRSNSFISKQFQ